MSSLSHIIGILFSEVKSNSITEMCALLICAFLICINLYVIVLLLPGFGSCKSILTVSHHFLFHLGLSFMALVSCGFFFFLYASLILQLLLYNY